MRETEKTWTPSGRPLTVEEVRRLSGIDVRRLDAGGLLELFEKVTDLRDSLLENEVSVYSRDRDRWEHEFSDTQVFLDRLRAQVRRLDGDPLVV